MHVVQYLSAGVRSICELINDLLVRFIIIKIVQVSVSYCVSYCASHTSYRVFNADYSVLLQKKPYDACGHILIQN